LETRVALMDCAPVSRYSPNSLSVSEGVDIAMFTLLPPAPRGCVLLWILRLFLAAHGTFGPCIRRYPL